MTHLGKMQIADSNLAYRFRKGLKDLEPSLQQEGEKIADRVVLLRDYTEATKEIANNPRALHSVAVPLLAALAGSSLPGAQFLADLSQIEFQMGSVTLPYVAAAAGRGHDPFQMGLLALAQASPSEQPAIFELWEDNPLKQFYTQVTPDHKPGLMAFQSWEFAEQQGWHDPITWTIGALKPCDPKQNTVVLRAALPTLDQDHPVGKVALRLASNATTASGIKKALTQALEAVSQGGRQIPPTLLAAAAAHHGASHQHREAIEKMELPDHPATRLLRGQPSPDPQWELLGKFGQESISPALLRLSRPHLLPKQLVMTRAALETRNSLYHQDARMAAWRVAPEEHKETINDLARESFEPAGSGLLGGSEIPIELELDPDFLVIGGHPIPVEGG